MKTMLRSLKDHLNANEIKESKSIMFTALLLFKLCICIRL